MYFVINLCETKLFSHVIISIDQGQLVNSLNYIHYEMWGELLFHSQTSMAALLKFGNVWIISYYTLLGMWLFIHAEIKTNLG